MKWLFFSLRRCLADKVFLLALILTAVVVALAPAAGRSAEYPPAGLCDLDGSAEATQLINSLQARGFLFYDSQTALIQAVQKGEVDCGVVILSGLQSALKNRSLSGALLMLTTPSSYAVSAWQMAAAAELFKLSAPYITVEALREEVPREEVFAAYEEYFLDEAAFAFEIRQYGTDSIQSDRESAVTLGAVALSAFVLVLYSSLGLMRKGLRDMAAVIGLKRAVSRSLLPAVLVREVLIAAALSVGLAVGRMETLIPAACAYTLLLWVLAALMAALIPGDTVVNSLLPLLLLAGLALCPIFIDLTLLIPQLKAVRALTPLYWLWYASRQPLYTALIGAVLVPAGLWFLTLSASWRYKLRR